MSIEAVGIKAVASGGVGSALLVLTIGDVEFMSLVSMGLFASLSSFLYDWSHDNVPPREFGLKEITCVLKYVFYGIALQFTVFYLGMNHGADYIELPGLVWGLLAGISAGSAVAIVNWFTPKIKALAEKALGKIK